MKFQITNATWLTILFLVLASISIYMGLTEAGYSLRHAVIDIESTMMFIASIFFYKEEAKNGEDTSSD